MEIFEFLELSARRIVGLALLAVLVAVPTAAVFAVHETTHYKATATARLAPFVPPGTGAGIQDEIDSGYQAALAVPSVLGATAAATRVPVPSLRNNLAVAFPNAGTTAEVTYTGTRANAAAVARTAAAATLRFLAQQEVDQARTLVAQADQRAARSIAAFQAFEARTGIGDAATRLDALTQQQANLAARLAQTPGEPAMASVLDSTRAELAQVDAAFAQYSQLHDAVDEANNTDQGAYAALTSAQDALATASSNGAVALQQVFPIGHLKDDLIYGFTAGLVAVLIAVAALTVEQLRRRAPAGWGTGGEPRLTQIASAGRRAARLLSPMRLAVAGTVLLLPASLALTGLVLFLFDQHRSTLAIAFAAPLGLLAGVLAVTRFELFLASAIVVRASLDSFNVSTRGTAGLDPGLALGGVFAVASVLWLAAQRRSGRWARVSRVTWALWAFVAACVVSIPASVLPGYSVVSTSKVIAGVLMFSVLEQYLGQRPERAKAVVWWLFLSLPVPAAIGLSEWLTHRGNVQTAGLSRVTSTFVHPSTFALYLLLVLPLALVLIGYYRGGIRALLVVIAATCGLLIVVTYTRDAWIAAIVSVGYLGIRLRRQLLWVMLVAVAALLIAVPSVAGRFADLHARPLAPGAPLPENSLSWRLSYWHKLVPLADANPVTGIGFETVERTTTERLGPHNGFVEAYVETGVIGLAALCWVCWEVAVYVHRRAKASRPGWDRLVALAAVAVALGLLVQLPGENLLTQTLVLWYAAVAMTFGLPVRRRQQDVAARAPELSALSTIG